MACQNGYCTGLFFGLAGSGDLTVAEACCKYLGGYRSGLGVRMDAFSSVTCSASNASDQASVDCKCSNLDHRYDRNRSRCVGTCDENSVWSNDDRMDKLRGMNSPVGACVVCPNGKWSDGSFNSLCEDVPSGTYSSLAIRCAKNTYSHAGATACRDCRFGSYSSEGAETCESCSLTYMLSTHCDFPAGGVLFLTLFVIVVASIIYTLVHFCRRLKQTKHEVAQAIQEIEMLGDAWALKWSEIVLRKKMAAGGYGEVWSATLRDQYEVAVKIMFDSRSFKEDDEIKVLMRIRHPRLVMFIGCGRVDETNKTFVCLEFMDKGDLKSYLWIRDPTATSVDISNHSKEDDDPPEWRERVSLLADVADAMTFLHRSDMIHRDLKSANILLGSAHGSLVAKVADFGLSRFLKSSSSISQTPEEAATDEKIDHHSTPDRSVSAEMTTFRGSLFWMAPEIFQRGRSSKTKKRVTTYSLKADVYSFGIVLWEALSLQAPWSHDPKYSKWMMAVISDVEAGKRPPVSRDDREGAPEGFVDLMKRCWQTDPRQRPNFGIVLAKLRQIRSDTREKKLPTSETDPTGLRAKVLIEMSDS
eukprot:g3556.t1